MLGNRKNWFRIAVLLLAIGIAFLILPPYEQYCQADHANEEYCTAYKIAVAFGALVELHNGVIAALAGLAVAIFTLTLKWSTDKLWIAGNNALQTTERAFVFLDGFNYELTLATDQKNFKIEHLPEKDRSDPELAITRFAVLPRWKNAGNTPTKNMTFNVGWRGPPGPIPPDYVYPTPPEPFFLAPKAVEQSRVIEMPGVSILVDWANFPVGDKPLVLIWGRADYEDVFGGRHFIEWCYRLRLERHRLERMSAGFLQWGDHNRSDEDTRG